MANHKYLVEMEDRVIGHLLISFDRRSEKKYALFVDVFDQISTEEFPIALKDRNIARVLLWQLQYKRSCTIKLISHLSFFE